MACSKQNWEKGGARKGDIIFQVTPQQRDVSDETSSPLIANLLYYLLITIAFQSSQLWVHKALRRRLYIKHSNGDKLKDIPCHAMWGKKGQTVTSVQQNTLWDIK